MKKLLLIGGLALGLSLSSTAQKFESKIIGAGHQEVIKQTVKFPENSTFNAFGPQTIKGTPNRDGAAVVDLGFSRNAFWLRTELPRLIVDKASGTTLFMHNGDNENFSGGDHIYDYTTNGIDWETGFRAYVFDDDQFKGGNYVNPMVFNPEGSANVEDVKVGYITQNPTDLNGVWGGFAVGSFPIGTSIDDIENQEVIFEPDADYFTGPIVRSCRKGNIFYGVFGNNDHNGAGFTEEMFFVKGEFNAATAKVDYTRSLIPVTPGLWDAEYGPYQVHIEFDDAGQTGYIFTTGNAVKNLFENCWLPSFLMKTTDGGANWSEVKAFEYGGENLFDALRGLVTEADWDKLYVDFLGEENPLPFPGEENLKWENYRQTDGVVDANGDLHMIMSLNLLLPSVDDPESFYLGATGPSIPLVHVYTEGGTMELKTDLIASLQTSRKTYEGEDGTAFASVDHNHRPRVVPAPDGEHLLFIWSDSELIWTEDEFMGNNDRPSIFARGYKLGKDGQPGSFDGQSEVNGDGVVKLTHQTAADESAFFYTTSDVLPWGKNNSVNIVQVPLLYGAFENQTNPNLGEPIYNKFLGGVTYQFSPVSLDEVSAVNSIIDVKQNRPNPFNGTTTIDVKLDQEANLSLEVTNVIGQQVMLIDKGQVTAGEYPIVIDGNELGSGIYFYTVKAGMTTITKKMIVE